MGYTKGIEIKIIRVKHKVTFTTKTTAHELRVMLSNVPLIATVDEVLSNYPVGEPDANCSIEFHEERLSDEN